MCSQQSQQGLRVLCLREEPRYLVFVLLDVGCEMGAKGNVGFLFMTQYTHVNRERIQFTNLHITPFAADSKTDMRI